MRDLLGPTLLLFAISAGAETPIPPRFQGSATLHDGPSVRAGGRFVLQAALRAEGQAAASDRFQIVAAIKPASDLKSLSTACSAASATIFANSFEN
ncbi:hypothetical protein C7S18_15345 [Ahniella affigens]|uniref:Uncharacterized protein n=1 Tax=Ahniella affigens TaxID=2021234 RepID=A0A2P1PUE7_9GAMM|nr:hypothetical protein [Ahniella affigens]AVP98476.1 hypothetical protein C7S18_15345 [Ahniella affigens]